MLRWLLIATVIFLVWRLLTGRPLFPGSGTGSPTGPGHTPHPSGQGAEAMVRCKLCGIHVPAQKAILEGDDWYCCPEHRDEACH